MVDSRQRRKLEQQSCGKSRDRCGGAERRRTHGSLSSGMPRWLDWSRRKMPSHPTTDLRSLGIHIYLVSLLVSLHRFLLFGKEQRSCSFATSAATSAATIVPSGTPAPPAAFAGAVAENPVSTSSASQHFQSSESVSNVNPEHRRRCREAMETPQSL